MIATAIHSKMDLWQEIIEVLCIIVLLFLSAVTEIFNVQTEAASFGPNK